MDNAPYHSMQINKPPSAGNRKAEIQNWLREHEIHYDESWTKSELLQLLINHKPEKDYLIDNLLPDHGYETLRLPPYNCDLNPIEYVWNLVKQRVAEKNVDQLEKKIEDLTRAAIASITVEDWQKQINHVKKLENDYWKREVTNEEDIENFIISIGLNSESESDSYVSDDYNEVDGAMSGIKELSDDRGEGPCNRI